MASDSVSCGLGIGNRGSGAKFSLAISLTLATLVNLCGCVGGANAYELIVINRYSDGHSEVTKYLIPDSSQLDDIESQIPHTEAPVLRPPIAESQEMSAIQQPALETPAIEDSFEDRAPKEPTVSQNQQQTMVKPKAVLNQKKVQPKHIQTNAFLNNLDNVDKTMTDAFDNALDAVKKFTGVASWYGPGFHGKKTASGPIYDMNQLTAAHKTLPFGTRVLVTNKRNGISTIVTINDRGPYVPGRVLDLSKAAASKLDMIRPGTVPVEMQIL